MPELVFVTRLDDKGNVQTQLQKLDDQVKGLGDSAESNKRRTVGANDLIGDSFANVKAIVAGLGLTMGALEIAGWIKDGVAAAMEFQSSWAKVDVILRSTDPKTVTQIKDEILKMPPALGSASESAEALYQVISAGYADPAQAMQIMTEAAMAAKGGFTQTATAVDAGTAILSAYGLQAKDATGVFDIMAKSVDLGKLTFEQMATQMGQIVPIAAASNINFKELSGGVAALTLQGLPASQAITGLRATISSILKPSSEATKLAKDLGIEWNESALKSKSLAGFIEELGKKGNLSGSQIATLTGSVEAANAVMALTSKAGGESLKNILNELDKSAGASKSAFEKYSQSLTGRMDELKNKIYNLASALGDKLAPIVSDVLGYISDFIDIITSGSIPLGKLTIGVTAFGVALVALNLNAFGSSLATLPAKFASLGSSIAGVAMGPFGMAVAAAAVAVGAFSLTRIISETKVWGVSIDDLVQKLYKWAGVGSGDLKQSQDDLTRATVKLKEACTAHGIVIDRGNLSLEAWNDKMQDALRAHINVKPAIDTVKDSTDKAKIATEKATAATEAAKKAAAEHTAELKKQKEAVDKLVDSFENGTRVSPELEKAIEQLCKKGYEAEDIYEKFKNQLDDTCDSMNPYVQAVKLAGREMDIASIAAKAESDVQKALSKSFDETTESATEFMRQNKMLPPSLDEVEGGFVGVAKAAGVAGFDIETSMEKSKVAVSSIAAPSLWETVGSGVLDGLHSVAWEIEEQFGEMAGTIVHGIMITGERLEELKSSGKATGAAYAGVIGEGILQVLGELTKNQTVQLAAIGASIGTAIAPGIGTAIGAAAGMLLGGLKTAIEKNSTALKTIVGAALLGPGGALAGLFWGLFTNSPLQAAVKDLARDFGKIKMPEQTFEDFAKALGLTQKQWKGIMKDLESSPQFLVNVAWPLAQAQGKTEEFLTSLESVQTAWGTFNFRDAFEIGTLTGDWSALNEEFIKAFGSSKELQKQLPNWQEALIMTSNISIEALGALANSTGEYAAKAGRMFMDMAYDSIAAGEQLSESTLKSLAKMGESSVFHIGESRELYLAYVGAAIDANADLSQDTLATYAKMLRGASEYAKTSTEKFFEVVEAAERSNTALSANYLTTLAEMAKGTDEFGVSAGMEMMQLFDKMKSTAVDSLGEGGDISGAIAGLDQSFIAALGDMANSTGIYAGEAKKRFMEFIDSSIDSGGMLSSEVLGQLAIMAQGTGAFSQSARESFSAYVRGAIENGQVLSDDVISQYATMLAGCDVLSTESRDKFMKMVDSSMEAGGLMSASMLRTLEAMATDLDSGFLVPAQEAFLKYVDTASLAGRDLSENTILALGKIAEGTSQYADESYAYFEGWINDAIEAGKALSPEILEQLYNIANGTSESSAQAQASLQAYIDKFGDLTEGTEEGSASIQEMLNTSMQSLIDKISELIDKIGGVSDATGEAIGAFDDLNNVSIDIPVNYITGDTSGLSVIRDTGSALTFASGGPVSGSYSNGTHVPAFIGRDEFVISGTGRRAFGDDFLSQINRGQMPSGNSSTYNFNINIPEGANAKDIRKLFREELIPEMKNAVRNNTGNLKTDLRRELVN